MSFKNIIKSRFLKIICTNRPRDLNLSDSPKFLILMNQKIGDMIVCSPILREIKSAYPNSQLHVLASDVNKEIAQANPYVDKVHVYKNQWPKLFPLLLSLRRLDFDVSVELEYKVLSRIIIILKIINPGFIVAVSKCEGRYGKQPQYFKPYDLYTNPNLTHQRDTALDILRLLNIECQNKAYDVFYYEQNKIDALSFLSSFKHQKITIGLNIEGSNNEKRISDNDLKNLILKLYSSNKNIVIILFHMPNDREQVLRLIPSQAKEYTYLSYPTKSVLDLAALVDNLDCVISPDTSIVHMACAFNKPMVAIYRNDPWLYEIWRPKSDCNYVVFSKYPNSIKDLDINEIVSNTSNLINNI